MEQLDKLGIDWKVFLAEVFNFLVLLGILWYFLYKKIFSIIEERQNKIDDGLKKSEEAEKILGEAKDEKADIILEARKEASEKIEKAVEIGKTKKEDIVKKAKLEADRVKTKAREDALSEKNKIIDDSKEEIAKMIILGTEKVLAEK